MSGKSARVGGRSDLRHAFTADELAEARAGRAKVEEDEYRRIMPAPLLVIYLLYGVERVGQKSERIETPYRDGLILPALGLHFPGAKDPDAPMNLVRYRLNRVAQKQLLPVDDEDVDDDINVDDADDD